MSKITKRKHVIKEALEDDFGQPTESQTIVRIVQSRGNNLHEVVAPNGDQFLVSMPTKFRNNVWVKRGSFVVVEPIDEGDKVKAEIVRILSIDHIKYLKKDKVWPEEFCSKSCASNENRHSSDDEIFVNRNRMHGTVESDSDDSESDE